MVLAGGSTVSLFRAPGRLWATVTGSKGLLATARVSSSLGSWSSLLRLECAGLAEISSEWMPRPRRVARRINLELSFARGV